MLAAVRTFVRHSVVGTPDDFVVCGRGRRYSEFRKLDCAVKAAADKSLPLPSLPSKLRSFVLGRTAEKLQWERRELLSVYLVELLRLQAQLPTAADAALREFFDFDDQPFAKRSPGGGPTTAYYEYMSPAASGRRPYSPDEIVNLCLEYAESLSPSTSPEWDASAQPAATRAKRPSPRSARRALLQDRLASPAVRRVRRRAPAVASPLFRAVLRNRVKAKPVPAPAQEPTPATEMAPTAPLSAEPPTKRISSAAGAGSGCGGGGGVTIASTLALAIASTSDNNSDSDSDCGSDCGSSTSRSVDDARTVMSVSSGAVSDEGEDLYLKTKLTDVASVDGDSTDGDLTPTNGSNSNRSITKTSAVLTPAAFATFTATASVLQR